MTGPTIGANNQMNSVNRLVSVIMPTYNSKNYLRDSILTVLEQTYEQLELIIVDDCSQDGTVSVARSFAAKDSRVKLIELNSNVGSGAARNAGVEVAVDGNPASSESG